MPQRPSRQRLSSNAHCDCDRFPSAGVGFPSQSRLQGINRGTPKSNYFSIVDDTLGITRSELLDSIYFSEPPSLAKPVGPNHANAFRD
jgi:hypothetical protein